MQKLRAIFKFRPDFAANVPNLQIYGISLFTFDLFHSGEIFLPVQKLKYEIKN